MCLYLFLEICPSEDGVAEALHQWEGAGPDDLHWPHEQNMPERGVFTNQTPSVCVIK